MKNRHSTTETGYAAERKLRLPHVGQRIIKTSVAVLICLLISYLRGFRAGSMSAEASITAIACMQPYVSTAAEYAASRFIGSGTGLGWGLALLILITIFPQIGANFLLLYLLIALGIGLCLYTAVSIKKPETSSIAAIVFLCFVINFPYVEQPFARVANQMAEILIGTLVAIGVNTFRLPRTKDRNQVFFVDVRDLVPDPRTGLSPAVLFQLNQLSADGALICLQIRHAPAFYSAQLRAVQLKLPMIVMDGAAVYDLDSGTYLRSENLRPQDSERVREKLESLRLSYFAHTIHDGRSYIFHQGEVREEEKPVLAHMAKSPYRHCLEGANFDPEEIVYLKVVVKDEDVERLIREIMPLTEERSVRTAVRSQGDAQGIRGVYIYDEFATIERAQKQMLEKLQEDIPSFRGVPVRPDRACTGEHDVMELLRKIRNLYEPVRLIELHEGR